MLKVNLGIPIVVAVNKSDLVVHGERKPILDEYYDFIQKHIREYAIQYGASVVYTSTTQKRNLDVWYQYILHRLYDLDLPFGPEFAERDTLFVPAGSDTSNLIEGLIKGQVYVDDDGEPLLYEKVV